MQARKIKFDDIYNRLHRSVIFGSMSSVGV